MILFTKDKRSSRRGPGRTERRDIILFFQRLYCGRPKFDGHFFRQSNIIVIKCISIKPANTPSSKPLAVVHKRHNAEIDPCSIFLLRVASSVYDREFQFWTVVASVAMIRKGARLVCRTTAAVRPSQTIPNMVCARHSAATAAASVVRTHATPFRDETQPSAHCAHFPLSPAHQMYGFDFRLNPAAQNYSIYFYILLFSTSFLYPVPPTGSHCSPVLATGVLL